MKDKKPGSPAAPKENKVKLLFEGPYRHEEVALMSPVQFSSYLKSYSKKLLEKEVRKAKVECEALMKKIQEAYVKGSNEGTLRSLSVGKHAYELLKYYTDNYEFAYFPSNEPKNGVFYRYGSLDEVLEDTLKVFIPTLEALDSLNNKISKDYISFTRGRGLGAFGSVALELRKDFPISTGYLGPTGI